MQTESLLESSDLITIAMPDTTIVYANPAYSRFCRIEQCELVGRRIIDIIPRENANQYQLVMEQISKENPDVVGVFKSLIEGESKWISWKESGIFDENGELVQILSVGRDIDDTVVKLRAERENVLSTLSALQNALDHHIIMSMTDSNGLITYVNDKFCAISKFSRDELLGKSHKIVNSGYHPASFFKNVWQTILAGNSWTGEIKNKAKDGTYYWVKSVIIPVMSNDVITNFLSLRIEITDRKKLERQKEEYIRTIENLLFGISHELRRPVATSLGILNLVKEELGEGQESLHEHIDTLIQLAQETDELTRKWNDDLTLLKNPVFEQV
jgi:PAS domain S-box-containing protein